jgi:hypothetical protein
MSDLREELHDWELDLAVRLFQSVVAEGSTEPLIDVDEICFFGALPALPESMDYPGTPFSSVQPPEVYIVGLKDGDLIAPEDWLVPPLREQLMEAGTDMQSLMERVKQIYRDHRQSPPVTVQTAVVIGTGQAITIQKFDRLPDAPSPSMTAADFAFDQWVSRIGILGSAFEELNL